MKKRRTWVYVHPPKAYELYCSICKNKDVLWSEFQGHVWCWRCLKDTTGTVSVFNGPVPVHGLEIIGLSFDRIDLKTGRWLTPITENGKVVYKPINST